MNQEPYTPNEEQGGAPYTPNCDPYMMPPEQKQSKGFAIASLVLGIASIVCCCLDVVSVVCAILAIVFAVLSRRQLGEFHGMAIAGLICGIVGLALSVYLIVDGILNPASDVDPEIWEQYFKMLEDMMNQSGAPTPSVFRLL